MRLRSRRIHVDAVRRADWQVCVQARRGWQEVRQVSRGSLEFHRERVSKVQVREIGRQGKDFFFLNIK